MATEMPPTFLYMLAVMVWLCLASVIWLLSACLLVVPKTRPLARSLALAMAWTFPTVIAAQLTAIPLAVGILAAGLLAIHFIEPNVSSFTQNPIVIGITLCLVLAEFLVVGGMSLLGFFEGWRAGWLLARGRSFRSVLSHAPSMRMFRAFRRGR